MKRLIYVGFDQLHRNFGALKDADPKNDVILLVESQRMLQSRTWHLQRLWFMISAARHFAQDLQDEGFEVIYLKAETTKDGIIQTKKSQKITNVISAEPHSFRLLEIFQTELTAEIDLIATDFFLTAKSDFKKAIYRWNHAKDSFVK